MRITFSEAREILNRTEEGAVNEPIVRNYYQVIADGVTAERKYCMSRLLLWQNDLSDEVPPTDVRVIIDRAICNEIEERVVRGPTIRYKCQQNARWSFSLQMQRLFDQGLLFDGALERDFTTWRFDGPAMLVIGCPTARFDVMCMNGLAHRAISALEEKLEQDKDCQ